MRHPEQSGSFDSTEESMNHQSQYFCFLALERYLDDNVRRYV